MVDTSTSQTKVIQAERGASFRFIDHILRENKDKIFIHAVRYGRHGAANR